MGNAYAMLVVRYEARSWLETAIQIENEHEVLRRGVLVRGVVQGVGFRPFVYRLAAEEGLAGFIGNDTDGVTIEIEGPAGEWRRFCSGCARRRRRWRGSIRLRCANWRRSAKTDSGLSPAR